VALDQKTDLLFVSLLDHELLDVEDGHLRGEQGNQGDVLL
jgi:hypothetical protein